jgi:hypothetical protein
MPHMQKKNKEWEVKKEVIPTMVAGGLVEGVRPNYFVEARSVAGF